MFRKSSTTRWRHRSPWSVSLLLTVALLAAGGINGCGGRSALADSAPPCAAAETPLSTAYDAPTHGNKAFNQLFRHCFTTVDGVQMHYVIGGTGPQTVVMLHGWPENWYEFHSVMPDLLPGRTVIAVDLPGMGDSTGQPSSYTKSTLATYVHDLLVRIGRANDIRFVAHDFGVGVAYALAARYREQAAGLFLIDFPLVGKNLTFEAVRPLSWHFSFNLQEPLAEDLVSPQVGTFLTYFFLHSRISPPSSGRPDDLPVAPDALAEYVRVYSRPQVLHGGFELYRNWAQDQKENAILQQTPLAIPVRLLTQDGLVPLMLPAVQDAAPAATGTDVVGGGHWLLDEQPHRVVAEVNAFYPLT